MFSRGSRACCCSKKKEVAQAGPGRYAVNLQIGDPATTPLLPAPAAVTRHPPEPGGIYEWFPRREYCLKILLVSNANASNLQGHLLV